MRNKLISKLAVKWFYGEPSNVYLIFGCIFVGVSKLRKRVIIEFCV